MLLNFIIKLRSELIDEKMKLEYQQNKIQNEIDCNDKFLQRLKQEEEQSYDVFSPRRKNLKIGDNILNLKHEQDTLKNTNQEIGQKLLFLNNRLDELENLIRQEKIKQNREVKKPSKKLRKRSRAEVNSESGTVQDQNRDRVVKSLIQRVELCIHILMVDPNRCKLELFEIKKLLLEIQEQLCDK